MKFLSIITIATLVFTPTIAHADWVKVAQSNQGSKAYVDTDSINRFGDNVVFNQRLVDSDRTVQQLAASCVTGQFQQQQAVVNGVQWHLPNGQPFPVQQARMGSLYGATIQFACGNH